MKTLKEREYDEVIKQLNAGGAGAPKGRSYHVCFGDSNNLFVSDIWDNMVDFQAFGQILMLIMQSMRVEIGRPVILPIQNAIVG